jgi:hypothetical protein
VIIFGSVRFLLKKNNQTKIFFFEKKTETGSNRPVSVRFWLGFFWFWLSFFRFGSVFPVWLGFFGFGSVFCL